MTHCAARILRAVRANPGIGRSRLLDAFTRGEDRALGRRTAEGLDIYLAELRSAGLLEEQAIPPDPFGPPRMRYYAVGDRP